MIKLLAAYFVTAMLAWAPPKEHVRMGQSVETTQTRYESIALDIAEVVSDSDEQPIFPGPNGRALSGLILESIAFNETRFWKHVDEGNCKLFPALGTCDGGIAFTMWQIHVGNGIILYGDTLHSADSYPVTWQREHKFEIINGAKLIGDRKLAARVALHMVRYSIKNFGDLRAYTGESGPDKSKAKLRLEMAQQWLRANPPMLSSATASN